jgi:hypothetical protein
MNHDTISGPVAVFMRRRRASVKLPEVMFDSSF